MPLPITQLVLSEREIDLQEREERLPAKFANVGGGKDNESINLAILGSI